MTVVRRLRFALIALPLLAICSQPFALQPRTGRAASPPAQKTPTAPKPTAPPAQGSATTAPDAPVELARNERSRALGEAFRAGALPAPAPLPEGDIDTQAARLAEAISAGDEHSTSALVAALAASGYGVRRADGTVVGAARGGQGMALDAWQVAAMAKLYGQDYGVPLDRLAAAFARGVPEFKDAPLASQIVEGLRAAAEREDNPPLRFWARFIIELGRHAAVPYDLLKTDTPATVRLDAIQTQLILARLAGDLAVLEKRGAGARTSDGARGAFEHGETFGGARFVRASARAGAGGASAPQAGPPCSTSDLEGTILDTNATATTTAFGQLAEYLSEHGYGGVGSYAQGAGRANLVLMIAKFLATYAALDVKIALEGNLLTRTKNTEPGERRKLTATVKSDMGNWQMFNCLRPALNAAGLDFSLPGDGPVANVKVTWNLMEGGGLSGLAAALDTATHLSELLAGQDHDTGAIVFLDTAADKKAAEKEYYSVTDGNGQASIYAVGAAQREDLTLKGATGVSKQAVVTVSVQAKPTKLKDATAAASTSGDMAGAVIAGLSGDALGAGASVATETLYRSQWYSSDPFTFEVRDWEPCAGGWTGTITREEKNYETRTADADGGYGPVHSSFGSGITDKVSCDLFTTGDPSSSEGTCRMRAEYEAIGLRNRATGNTCCVQRGGDGGCRITSFDTLNEDTTTGSGAGQSEARVELLGDVLEIHVDPIEFGALHKNTQKLVGGCQPHGPWGSNGGDFDNRDRTTVHTGNFVLRIKANQLKGSRTDTLDDGTRITYTWDLNRCGAKRGA
ncbi:MAG: hypothetical protein ACJ741_16880 [Pyrinomonadaceae bacterium]